MYGLVHEPLNQSIIANRRLGVTRVVFVQRSIALSMLHTGRHVRACRLVTCLLQRLVLRGDYI